MEYLRWILLVAGLVFVLIVYLLGKSRKQQLTYDDYESDVDAPEFSAKDWDKLEEGVGEVRIVAREDVENDYYETDKYAEDEYDDDMYSSEEGEETTPDESADSQQSNNDIIVLYVLARASGQLMGDRINSVAQANNLSFGKMNIFHRLDASGQTAFSMANMMEPGNFDPESMHELETSGIILFMQVSAVSNPDEAFDDMLECAYHISEMLDAQLCNQKRQPFTQADADEYRAIVAGAHA